MKSRTAGIALGLASLFLSASVAFAAGNALPGANVIVRDNASHIVSGGMTDVNGEITLKSLPAGDYVVQVRSDAVIQVADDKTGGLQTISVDIHDASGHLFYQRYSTDALKTGILLNFGIAKVKGGMGFDSDIVIHVGLAPTGAVEDFSC